MVGLPNLLQASKLKSYLGSVSTSEKLLKEFEQEFADIVVYIMQIKNKTELAFQGTNTLEVEELIKALIKVSDIGSDIDPNLRIINLKVIRKVVELANPGCDSPASEWGSDDWEKFQDEVVAKQKLLKELGVVNLLCNILAKETKRTIREEALLVAIACTIGGNEDVQ